MMDHQTYSTSQSYPIYDQNHWPDNNKPVYTVDDDDDSVVVYEDKELTSVRSDQPSSESTSRRASMLKTEDEFCSTGPVWHDRSLEPHTQMRHFSHPHLPVMQGQVSHYVRNLDPNVSAIHQQSHWVVPQSGSSTPTPMFTSVEAYGQSANYGPAPAFPNFTHDPASAVSMSPQSSQGGWASNNSSDGAELKGLIHSPAYRPPSPNTVLRSDGIRKKNARFEIPKERNLANIDAMILASTDEGEKKELKQQKRLLRNRQAALDSRQRKKTHTEKLEQEKKISDKKMFDMEEALARTEAQLSMEREQWLSQQQQMEQIIHTLQYDRDEAIRTKTVETGELRKLNNVLKDMVRDLERQQNKGYAPASDIHTFSGGFNEFDLHDNWNNEFSLLDGDDDFKMDSAEHLQRQATPRPQVTLATETAKTEVGFSWNTFYMCLLFGAFIASNSNSQTPTAGTTSAIASSISPSEAGKVLKAVLNKGSDSSHAVLPVQAQESTSGRPAEASHVEAGPTATPTSSLDNLHQTLSTPSRHQEIASVFQMSASSYNHILDPFDEQYHNSGGGDTAFLDAPKPTQLQQAYANMQTEKDELERRTGLGAQARERSLLWDQVPPQVVKDFQELVRRTNEGAENVDHYLTKKMEE